MKYAQIREMDVSNGKNIGVALFVQGCHFSCKNCFNPETHDFNGGKEWTLETEKQFIKLADRPYIKRISLLGGEPLADENLDDMLNLVNKIRLSLPKKIIWLYSGYTLEQITFPICINQPPKLNEQKRIDIIKQCDVLVDGRYIDELKDITLKFRGSSNQRVIDIQETLKQNKIILYCD